MLDATGMPHLESEAHELGELELLLAVRDDAESHAWNGLLERVERRLDVVVQGPRRAVVLEVAREPGPRCVVVEGVAVRARELSRASAALLLEGELAGEVRVVVPFLEFVPERAGLRDLGVVSSLAKVREDARRDRLAMRHERVVEVEQHDGAAGRRLARTGPVGPRGVHRRRRNPTRS